MLDWLRLWPELIRLNFEKARHARRLRRDPRLPVPPAPCQSASDSGRAGLTHCEACLRFDQAARYRRVCPALRLRADDAYCSLDAADVRPDWPRVAAAFVLPPVALALLAVLVAWLVLRFGAGIRDVSPADLAWPPRWPRLAEKRRAHFHALALDALRRGDVPATGVALFSAAQIGAGSPSGNRELARLATLGGYHSLADEIHSATLAAHPAQADEIALAWHDDLLVSGRPHQLARLALGQLARPGASREFWLRAFFESIRHPGVAANLLESPRPPAPHPGLEAAIAARAALDRGDRDVASDQLLAFSGLLPGQAARRFLTFSWLDTGDPARARAAALSTAHPAPPGEIAALVHALLRADGNAPGAREALRPLFARPELRPLAVGALVLDPDAELVRELASALSATQDAAPSSLLGLWLAARRAGAADVATRTAESLRQAGQSLPAELQDGSPGPASRKKLALAAGLFPLDREILYALRAAP